MADWLYSAAQATLSLIRSPRAHENLSIYAKAASLPEMRLAPGAPALPKLEKSKRVDYIRRIQHELYRALEAMDMISTFEDNASECTSLRFLKLRYLTPCSQSVHTTYPSRGVEMRTMIPKLEVTSRFLPQDMCSQIGLLLDLHHSRSMLSSIVSHNTV